MKGKTIKAWVVGFALVLALAPLAACGAPAATNAPSSAAATTVSTATDSAAATATPAAEAKNYWDMLDSVSDSSDLPAWTGKQLKLTVWMAHGTGDSEHPTATNNVVAAEIKRVTGVEIDVENSFDNGGNNLETKLSMLAAANDWPSMVLLEDTNSIKQLVENNKLYDLTTALPQNMPHVKSLFFQDGDGLVAKSQMISDRITAKVSDKVYFVPTQANWVLTQKTAMARSDFDAKRWNYIKAPETPTGGNRIWVRDDLLKKLYPNAMTQDEIEAAYLKDGTFTKDQIFDVPLKTSQDFWKFMYDMKALIDKEKITEDGKPVEVSYAATGQDNWQLMACLLPMVNGLPNVNYGTVYDRLAGKLTYAFDKPYFKDMVKTAQQAVKDGVLSEESLLDTNDLFAQKVNSGHYAVTYAWQQPDAEALKKAGKTFRYRYLWLDNQWNYSQFPNLTDTIQSGTHIGIFKDSVAEEDLPQVLHYIDYMCSDVGSKLVSWGPRSAGLFKEENGTRVYTDKDLEDNMVYLKDNGKNVEYGLLNYRLPANRRSSWPVPVVAHDEDWNNPRYTYDARQRTAAEANIYFNPGILPGYNVSEHQIMSSKPGFIWVYTDMFKLFQDGRTAFEQALTKTLAAQDDAQFEKLYGTFVDTAKSIGLTDEVIAAADKEFKDANKDMMDQINAEPK